MASRVVATAPILLSKLSRNLSHHPYGPTPLSTARWSFSKCYPPQESGYYLPQKYYFCTNPPPQKSSLSTCSPLHKSSIYDDMNPFLRVGELGPCRVDKTKNNHYIMRVDVPGIPKDKMILWVESDHIYFTARDYKIPDYGYDGRVFGGSIRLNTEKFDSGKVRFDVRNGVLWIIVPELSK